MRIPDETFAVGESLIAAAIFWSPNLLYFAYVPFWVIAFYDYFIMFALLITIAHLKFGNM